MVQSGRLPLVRAEAGKIMLSLGRFHPSERSGYQLSGNTVVHSGKLRPGGARLDVDFE
jgi:hypothetical protein